MITKRINKAVKATRTSTGILIKARNKILKSSFKTMKSLGKVYVDAGTKTFRIGKEVFKETLHHTKSNNKELFATAEKAFRSAMKEYTSKTKNRADEDLSIDDLLESDN